MIAHGEYPMLIDYETLVQIPFQPVRSDESEDGCSHSDVGIDDWVIAVFWYESEKNEGRLQWSVRGRWSGTEF